MEKNIYRTDRPQDEIPKDIWINNVLEEYHKEQKTYQKEHKELESLRSYAKGLEEENVLLNKKLDKFMKEENNHPNVYIRNQQLKEEILRLKDIIERDYKVRVFRLSSYKKLLQRQHKYLCQLEKLLDANGIKYHKMAKTIIEDADNIDVTAVRMTDDLKETNRLLDEEE